MRGVRNVKFRMIPLIGSEFLSGSPEQIPGGMKRLYAMKHKRLFSRGRTSRA
jgi:hypothetical protein